MSEPVGVRTHDFSDHGFQLCIMAWRGHIGFSNFSQLDSALQQSSTVLGFSGLSVGFQGVAVALGPGRRPAASFQP